MNFTQMLIEILARYTFETNLFERRKEGIIHVKELNQLLLNAQNFAYGDGLSEEKHPYMWICKPHYYFPDFHFYNFPYPFALLFSKGLTSMYREKKKILLLYLKKCSQPPAQIMSVIFSKYLVLILQTNNFMKMPLKK